MGSILAIPEAAAAKVLYLIPVLLAGLPLRRKLHAEAIHLPAGLPLGHTLYAEAIHRYPMEESRRVS
jgi:hypothetical protein